MHSTRDQASNLTAAIGQSSQVWALWICIGAALGGLGVAIGAAGTHALEGRIEPDALDTLETAVRFQMYHAIALVGIGVIGRVWDSRVVTLAGALMAVGTIIFCGSLYLIALLDLGVFGAVAPVGGLSLMAAWAALAVGAGIEFARHKRKAHR